MDSGELPLAGITVVSLEQAVAAPIASRHLADLGARVIKVERVGEGDFARNYDTAVHGLELNDMQSLIAHPQLAARDRWREVGTEAGPICAGLRAAGVVGQES
ncbi:hypothetical protein GCM10010409_10560 [Mycolicibacterium diernhoferi]|nr:hypothetical protein BRW64_14180 [Mycolicibacterium diernhoferi]